MTQTTEAEAIVLGRDRNFRYGIQIAGQSMAPAYPAGRDVFFDPSIPVQAGYVALFYRADGTPAFEGCALRKLDAISDTHWTVSMSNPPETFEYDRAVWPVAHMMFA